jgi:hypothetical protein
MSEGTETNISRKIRRKIGRKTAQIGELDLRISESDNLGSIFLDRRGSVPSQALDA